MISSNLDRVDLVSYRLNKKKTENHIVWENKINWFPKLEIIFSKLKFPIPSKIMIYEDIFDKISKNKSKKNIILL